MTKTILICFLLFFLFRGSESQSVLEKRRQTVIDRINDLRQYITKLNSLASLLEQQMNYFSRFDLKQVELADTQYNITFINYQNFTNQVSSIRTDASVLLTDQIAFNPANKDSFRSQNEEYNKQLQDIKGQLQWSLEQILEKKSRIDNQRDIIKKMIIEFNAKFDTYVKEPQKIIGEIQKSLVDAFRQVDKAIILLDGKNQTLHDNAQQAYNFFKTQHSNALMQIRTIQTKCREVYKDALGLNYKTSETELACNGFDKEYMSITLIYTPSKITAISINAQKIAANNKYANDIKPILTEIYLIQSIVIHFQHSYLKIFEQQEKPELLFNSTMQKEVFTLFVFAYYHTNQTNARIQNITSLNNKVNEGLKKANINVTTEADQLIHNLLKNNTKNVDQTVSFKAYYQQLIASAYQNEKVIKEIDTQLTQYETITIHNSTQKNEINYWRSLMNKINPYFSVQTETALTSYKQLLEKISKELPLLKQNATNTTLMFSSKGYDSLAKLKGNDWEKRSSLIQEAIQSTFKSLPQIQLEIELDNNATQILDEIIYQKEQEIRYDLIDQAAFHGSRLLRQDTSFKLDLILSQNITIIDFISQFQSDQKSLKNQQQQYQNTQTTVEQQECKAKSGDVSNLFQSILDTYDSILNCLLLSQDELEIAFSLLTKFQRKNIDRWEQKQKSQARSQGFYGKIMDDFVTCPVDIDIEGNSGMDIFIQESSLTQYKIYKPINQLRQCQGAKIESMTVNLLLQIQELVSKTGSNQALGCIFNTKELEKVLLIQKTALSNSEEMNKLMDFLEQRLKSIKNLQMACWGKFLADSRHKKVTTVIYQEQNQAFYYYNQMKDLFSEWVVNTTFKAKSCCDVFPFHAPALEFLKTRIQYQEIISIQLHLTQILNKPPKVMQLEIAEARLLQAGGMSVDDVSKMFSKLYETDHQGVDYMYENQQYYLVESMLKVARDVIYQNQESKKFIDSLINKSRNVFNQTKECQNHDIEAILKPLASFVDAWNVFESEIKNATTKYSKLHESNMESILLNDQHRLIAEQTLQQINEYQQTQVNISTSQMQFFIINQFWMLEARNGLQSLNTSQITINSILNAAKEGISSIEKNKLAPLYYKVLDVQNYETYQNMYYDFGKNKIPLHRKINATLALQEAKASMAVTGMKLYATKYLIDNLTVNTVDKISVIQRLKDIKENVVKITILNDKASDSQLQASKSYISLFIQQGIKNYESKTFSCVFNKLSDVHSLYDTAGSLKNQTEPQYLILRAFIQYISVTPTCDYVLQNIINNEQQLFFEQPNIKEQEQVLLDKLQYKQCVNELIDEIGTLSLSFLEGVILPTFSWCLIESMSNKP